MSSHGLAIDDSRPLKGNQRLYRCHTNKQAWGWQREQHEKTMLDREPGAQNGVTGAKAHDTELRLKT